MKISFELWSFPAHTRGIDGVLYMGKGPAYTSVRPYSTIEDWAKMLHEYGYEGVSPFYEFIQWMQESGNYKEMVKRVNDTLPSYGMVVDSIAAHGMQNCLNPRPWARRGAVEGFKKAIQAARDLNANAVCSMGASGFLVNVPDDKAWEMMVSAWKEAAKTAEEYDVNISAEFINSNRFTHPLDLVKFVEEVGSEKLGLTWDTCHNTVTTRHLYSLEEAMTIYSKYWNNVHAKDGWGSRAHWQFPWWGMGEVNFGEQARILKKLGYKGFVNVEFESWFPGQPHVMLEVERVAKDSIAFLRKWGF